MPVKNAGKLKGKLLIVHGTADDNVHVLNSMELVEALTQEKKGFEVHFLPDKRHGIAGGPTHLHLFWRMTDFVLREL